MNIGIIGAGLFGKTLARKLKKAGHEIRISNSRGPETLQEFSKETGASAVTTEDTVKEVEVVIIIIPFNKISTLSAIFKDVPKSTIVMDAMNYYPVLDGRIEAIERGITDSEYVQAIIGRPVIKAVNSLEVFTLIIRLMALTAWRTGLLHRFEVG
ncbi:NAD(P)-binding domain-containing protein [Flavobacterium sp. DG1-102-2]|uniref:NADPH-dependent F420 reductase n=1 Tax=Flavobacterium sp. DG1-102-2 TaxID=3081663 RepID=UPI002948E8F3|nr:NAD(P)-binding domain-containing protein [Flavobacterium sp. DG1-102-2]MDV6167145.1 NAD(P)-binding domain-containing protein [Flavobacterium sp. DG1-102-2]